MPRSLIFVSIIALFPALSPAAENPAPAFRDITRESGLAAAVDRHYASFPKWWLSGMTLADLDGDGLPDLHLGSHSGPTNPAAFLRNLGASRFESIDPHMDTPRGPKARADLAYPGGEIRLPFDLDEDGRLDLLCSWHDGGGVLYMNATPAAAHCVAASATLFRRDDRIDPFSRATCFSDLDGDGLVDYLVDERDKIHVFRGTAPGAFAKKPVILDGLKEAGGGIPVDIDGDAKPDLLLTQRGYNPTARRILRNDTTRPGEILFTDITADSGLSPDGGAIHGVGDLNRDGLVDLICLEKDHFVLYFNDGKGHFKPQPNAIRGLEQIRNRPHYTNWGGAVVTDLDNDGWPDILVNGRNFLHIYRGRPDGTFEYANTAWGLPSGATSAVDEGLCFGDIDNDGRLDLVTCAGDEKRKTVALFHNDLPARNWLRVRLAGKPGNRSATGAVIRVYATGGKDLLWCEPIAIWGRQSFHSYYATPSTERHFGLGDHAAVDVTVTFSSGKQIRRENVPANRVVEITE